MSSRFKILLPSILIIKVLDKRPMSCDNEYIITNKNYDMRFEIWNATLKKQHRMCIIDLLGKNLYQKVMTRSDTADETLQRAGGWCEPARNCECHLA